MLNEMTFEEHAGDINGKKITIVALSYYKQASLVSGYVFHGNTLPGTAPNTAGFRIQREVLNTGEVLFASGNPAFTHTWSAASLASLTYL